MPVYEYSCNQCQKRFEKLFLKKPSSSEASIECPECHQADTRRVLSSFSSPAAESEFCPPGGCGDCPNQGGCWN